MSKYILKVTRKKKGTIERSDFQTYQECINHFEKFKALGYWGEEARVIHHPERQIIHPEEIIPGVPEVKDEQGNVITPEVLEVIVPEWVEVIAAYDELKPAEYDWEIHDRSAEEEEKELKDSTKRSDRISRVGFFKTIDWSAVDNLVDLKIIVRHLVREAIKDDEL